MQLAILSGVYWTGTKLAEWSGLPIPGSVMGVMLLFLLLLVGVIKLEQVEEVADVLLKNLMFFFVPVAVGVMNAADFLEQGPLLLSALFIGTLVPLWVTGALTQFLRKRQHECKR